MNNAEFNLLHEPWIVVMTLRGEVKEVSLLDVFEHAHEYRALAGELPTQDVAILRLLLAVLYATFTRAEPDGTLRPLAPGIDGADEALDRWERLWEMGSFPLEPIAARLEPYEEWFYLFHPERPFYQVAGLNKGTEYQAAKLLGDLSESNNKVRLFPTRTGTAKERLTNAEATRWLLYLNGYDDTSAKPSVRGAGLPSVGAGWLGKLGLVYGEGDTLFETLLLNFVLLDGNNEAWPFASGRATWELDEVHRAERERVTIPTNPLDLLTLQSRRILLKRENGEGSEGDGGSEGGSVCGYLLLGGDFFDKENAFIEQMTMWRKDSTRKEDVYVPKRHQESRQVWREFPSLLAGNMKEERQPGVISWMATLRTEGLLEKETLQLKVAGIQYADKDFYVDGIISDGLTMSTGLLSALGKGWVDEVGNLLRTTDQCVGQLAILASDLAESRGDNDEKSRRGVRVAVRERAYFALDSPFRRWLAGLDPGNDSHSEKELEWIDRARRIIRGIADDLIDEAGEKAMIGTYEAGEGSPKAINAFCAHHKFINSLARLCNVAERRKDVS